MKYILIIYNKLQNLWISLTIRNIVVFSEGYLSRMILEFWWWFIFFLKLDVILFSQKGLQVFLAPTIKLSHISLVFVRKISSILFRGNKFFFERIIVLLLLIYQLSCGIAQLLILHGKIWTEIKSWANLFAQDAGFHGCFFGGELDPVFAIVVQSGLTPEIPWRDASLSITFVRCFFLRSVIILLFYDWGKVDA